jgi:hypothetical protein
MTMSDSSVREFRRGDFRLADEVYMTWSAAQVECRHALESWLTAGPGDRAEANWAYRAALEREEAAARDLEWLSKLLSAA